jgi:hypothetical protein
VFAPSPPFAVSDPTSGDYEQLGDFVEARVKVLEKLLAYDAA